MGEFRDNQKVFKDAWLRSKSIPVGEYWEIGFPGFGLRVSPTGRKTFILAARFPGKAGGRRALGPYPVLSLESAHIKAKRWLELVEQGKDPQDEEQRAREIEQRKRDTTFEAVAKDFIADKLAGERKGKDAEREINVDLMPIWRTKPISEITTEDVVEVIQRKKRKRLGKTVGQKTHSREVGGKTVARNLLALIKRFFSWVVARRVYGLLVSPATNLTAKDLIGDSAGVSREHILSRDELFAFWRATKRWAYPYGPGYRLLMLAALRLNEAVEISRAELDPAIRQRLENGEPGKQVAWRDIPDAQSVWTIPKARMKGREFGAKQARDHVVPMTDAIMQLLASIPRFKGQYLFSTTGGEKPVTFGSKVKAELDRRMLVVLRALARRRGEDPTKITLDFVNHDLRRTARSCFAELGVSDAVAETLLAHRRPGIVGVYDRYSYLPERRDALRKWAEYLDSLGKPVQGNVIPFNQFITA